MDKHETAAFRDQQADAMGSVNDFVECSDEHCETSERWKNIKKDDSGWQISNNPDIPLLCPDCNDRVADETLTPTEARREYNREIAEFRTEIMEERNE